ncbi:MAG: gliding motility-associated-like protein [Halioglobus sp.]|jgi:gliding motility-associated-like protein
MNGQCDFTTEVPIEDESSVIIDFLVSGAVNNELGVDNCLMIVTTHFEHQFISDLTLELEAPSGDIVQLVGSDIEGSNTGLVNSWDIQFVNRDSLTAMPDFNYDEIWNSTPIGGWTVFTTYTGSYYPHLSGLENFTGPVNGVWKLHISDESQFGEGMFSCFGMEFCNDSMITVNSCEPITHSLDEEDVSLCEKSVELNLTIVPNLANTYDSSAYEYQYLFFDESGFQNLTTSTDFSSTTPGSYTLCGIHYFLDDVAEVEGIVAGIDLSAIEDFILDNDICATLSNGCIDIEIFDVPELITETRRICQGDTITIGIDNYTESGLYEVTTALNPCDSISMLDLEVVTLEVLLTSDNNALSCENPIIELDATDTDLTGISTFAWKTNDGNFISNPSSQLVEIDKAGTYVFEVVTLGCIFTNEIIITENEDFVEVEIFIEDITCLSDSAFVDLNTSDEIDDISWAGLNSFRQIGNDILVGAEGSYNVEFVTEFGCLVSRDIVVEDVREYPEFELAGDTLTCENPTTVLKTTNADTLNSNFFWIKDNDVLGMDTFLLIDQPGEYNLRVRTGDGCVDTFSIDINSQVDTIDVELFGGEIDCGQPEVIISYSSSISGLNPLWILPNEVPVVDSTFNSNQSGLYMLHLEDDKKCTLDTTLIVTEDLVYPEISVIEADFLCGQDSIQIMSSINITDATYEWTNVNGFRDTTPTPWIFAPGEYMVKVSLENGCFDIVTFTMGVDVDLPELSFEFSDLNCDSDTVYIVPSDTSSYDMIWSLGGVFFPVDSNIIRVLNIGLYEVIVTNPNNGCSSNYSFNIKEDKVSNIENITVNILNCENETVQINIDVEREFDSYQWSGPGLLDNNEEPEVDKPGLYYLNYQFTNGCVGIDSIEVFDEGELPNLMGRDTVYNCFSSTLTIDVTYESSTINIIWEGPNFTENGETATISEPGIYNVYAVAPGLCRDTIQINVVADTISPILSMVNDGIITCADSIVDIKLTVDAKTTSYIFSGQGIVSQNDLIIQVDKPGIYSAVGMADNGCTTTVTNEVSISNDFPNYVIDLDSISCINNAVTVGFTSSDPLLDVAWTGPTIVPDNTYSFTTGQTGTYSFTVTNSDGCRSIDSFFVFRDSFPPLGFIDLSNQITCDLEEVTLSIADYESSWSLVWTGSGVSDPNVETIITDQVGEYTVEITGPNGCLSSDTMEVLYDTAAAVIDVFADPITCTAGKVFLNVASNIPLISYEWTGPNFASTDVEPLVFESGFYQITVTSANGCVSSAEVEVRDERVFPILIVDDYYLPCDGAPAVVTATSISQGASTNWFGPSYFAIGDTAKIFEPGEYIGLAVSSDGCSTTDTFLVIDEPILPLFSAEAEILLCFGPIEILALNVSDDRSVLWQGPNQYTANTPLAKTEKPGLYTLVVTGDNGCVDSTNIEVIDGRVYPDAIAHNDDLFQCENLEINLSGSSSSTGSQYSYQWTTDNGDILAGENTLNPRVDGEGTYIIRVTDNSIGCISFDTLDLTIQEQDLMDLDLLITPPTCLGFENGIIEIENVIGGYGPFNIILDGNDYGERLDIPFLNIGEHALTIIDSLGCVLDSLVVIDTSTLLSVILPMDTILIFGETLNVLADINLPLDSISQITWSSNVPCDGCISFDIIPDGNMTISIEVIDINGCIVEKEFRITLNRPDKLPFPQIFSPNGDNINDRFYLPLVTGIQSIEYIKVYDSWGGLLYVSNNPIPGDESFGWDGTVNGQNAEIAVYIVEALVTLVDGKQVSYVGDLTLIR